MDTCPDGERVKENSLKRSRSRLDKLCEPGAGVAPGSVLGCDIRRDVGAALSSERHTPECGFWQPLAWTPCRSCRIFVSMLTLSTLLLGGIVVATGASMRAHETIDDSLRARVERRIANVSGATVGVA